MAKELTLPTPPSAPTPPRIGIGDRIQGIENRIKEIESIGNAHQVYNKNSNSNTDRRKSNTSQQVKNNEQTDSQDNATDTQVESRPQVAPQPQRQQTPSRTVTTPENMARDAVANGSGALTKRTTTRKSDEEAADADKGNTHKNQSTIVIPPDSALNDTGQTKFERGRAVLNEFKQLDKDNPSQSKAAVGPTKSTTQPSGLFAPSHDGQSQHGAVYWLFTLVVAGVLAFMFVNQFMLKKKSASKDKTTLSNATLPSTQLPANPLPATPLSSLKTKPTMATAKPPMSKPLPITKKPAVSKPVTTKPKKEDDNKGKHFEIRV